MNCTREKSVSRVLPIAAISFLTVLVCGCTANHAAPPISTGVPVVVSRVSQKAMPVEVSSVGNVEALSSVSIKAQVAGELLEVHFKEGDFVRRGQLLFTIDPRPYQAQVDQAQANIAKDQAQLQQAEANLARDTVQAEYARTQSQRFAALSQRGVVATDSSDQARSQAAALEESMRADRAAIESVKANLGAEQAALEAARLQLSYCTIHSPLDGRTGAVMLKPGNLLKAADVPIVVINQIDPIYVNFTVPQQYWIDIKKHMAAGMLRVKTALPQEPDMVKQGTVTFVDNAIDATTGTIHLRATFENAQNAFVPGMFVNVVLTLSEQAHATVVAAQAVTDGQNGPFVYVVKPDDTVEARPIVSSRTLDGLAVIDKGLEPGELVVVDGQTRLAPGTKVKTGEERANEHP